MPLSAMQGVPWDSQAPLEKDLLFQGEQEEDVLVLTDILSTPAATFRETCLHFSSGDMCEKKMQAIISCNSTAVNNKNER